MPLSTACPCRPQKLGFLHFYFSHLDTGHFPLFSFSLFSFSVSQRLKLTALPLPDSLTPVPLVSRSPVSLSHSLWCLSLSLSDSHSLCSLSLSLPPSASVGCGCRLCLCPLPVPVTLCLCLWTSGRARCPCLWRHPESLTPSTAPPPSSRLVSGYLVCQIATLLSLLSCFTCFLL